jgi:predicted nucleotidyltransferase
VSHLIEKNMKIENLPKELRKKDLRERLFEFCNRNDIVFMAFFGSFVRREQNRKSDIDVAIEFDKNSGKNLLDLVRMESELRKILKKKVDLGIFSTINPYIMEDIKKRCLLFMKKR